MNVQDHYKQHLSQIYGWMIGDFDTAQGIQQSILELNDVNPFDTRRAVDLGCGHGLQTVSLAKLGFTVQSVDTDEFLLQELNDRKGELPIITFHTSILDFLSQTLDQNDVIVCMGDTLTHLNSNEEVLQMIDATYKRLVPKGKLVLSFRDYAEPLLGEQRFIQVRSDENRILTCFLEYATDRVFVHDIFHERSVKGWTQRVSSYTKLRVSNAWVIRILEQVGFVTRHEEINRMHYIIAQKP